jgi:hypothetical protein
MPRYSSLNHPFASSDSCISTDQKQLFLFGMGQTVHRPLGPFHSARSRRLLPRRRQLHRINIIMTAGNRDPAGFGLGGVLAEGGGKAWAPRVGSVQFCKRLSGDSAIQHKFDCRGLGHGGGTRARCAGAPGVATSGLAGEGLVPQRPLQRLQRGVPPVVEAREALGFSFVHAGRASRGAALFSYSTTPTRRIWSSRAG